MSDILELYKKLDAVLKFVNHTSTFGSIRRNFDYDLEELKSILRQLRNDGYIILYRLGTKEVMPKEEEFGYSHDHQIHRSFQGDLFILKGGYTEVHKKGERVINWKMGRTIFDIILGTATFILALFSYRQGNKISDLQYKNEILKSTLDSLIKK